MSSIERQINEFPAKYSPLKEAEGLLNQPQPQEVSKPGSPEEEESKPGSPEEIAVVDQVLDIYMSVTGEDKRSREIREILGGTLEALTGGPPAD